MSASNARMSSVDRAWLLMERRTNPMMVVVLVLLATPLGREELRRLVEERFLAFGRFRARPEGDLLAAQWVEEPDFDVDAHVHALALPAPAGRAELERLVGELASEPLPANQPRWSFHLVTNYRRGSAVVVRIHHCYADGIALVRVFLGLTEPLAGDAVVQPAPAAAAAAGEGGSGWMESLLAPLRYLSHPGEALDAARTLTGLAQAAAQVLALPDDPPTALKRPLGVAKRVAWADPLPLGEVKTVAKVLGCTVNDVVMATLAGALGRYLRQTGEAVEGVTLRAAVPVNLRAAGESGAALGNRFGLCFVDLAIGTDHPLERLYAMHATMAALKHSPQPVLVLGVLAALGALPAPLEGPAVELFSAKASLVVSNVPGPVQPLRLGSAPIEQLLFWVPQSGSVGIGVSILTYAGRVHFGVIADRHLIRDPRRLTRLFEPEFERLVRLLLIGALAHEANGRPAAQPASLRASSA